MGIDISGGFGALSEAAAQFGAIPGNTFVNSMEQIFSPVLVKKEMDADTFTGLMEPWFSPSETGRFNRGELVGPSRRELDPYFTNVIDDKPETFFEENDYIIMSNDDKASIDANTADINIRKTARAATAVSGVGLRMPAILSGWGYDLADNPAPNPNQMLSEPDNEKFEPDFQNDRSLWKSGPVDLKWDDERMVWSGGPHIVAGIVQGDVPAAISPCCPASFKVKVLRLGPSSPDFLNLEGRKVESLRGISNCDVEETITVMNRDPSLYQMAQENMIFCIAIRLNYEWLPLWIGCPDEPCDGDGKQSDCCACASCDVAEMEQEVDEDGNPVVDENGNPVMIKSRDEDGNVITTKIGKLHEGAEASEAADEADASGEVGQENAGEVSLNPDGSVMTWQDEQDASELARLGYNSRRTAISFAWLAELERLQTVSGSDEPVPQDTIEDTINWINGLSDEELECNYKSYFDHRNSPRQKSMTVKSFRCNRNV
jgi:hypothetical protein